MVSNLLEKLSRQIQVMEKLSAVSDENIGNISSVIEGKALPITPPAVQMMATGAPLAASLPCCVRTAGGHAQL